MKKTQGKSAVPTRMTKKITMDDIARELGISKNSVSLALNEKKGVSEELRSQIIEKAIEMNYGAFAARQDARSSCIVVFVPEYLHDDTFFYSEVFWAIETEAKSNGYVTINVGITKEMEESLTLPVLQREIPIMGFLVIGVLRKSYIKKLYDKGYPMVTVDISYNNVPVGCVGSANMTGGYMATKYLIENGHKRIGFIGPAFIAISNYERWCGYNLAMHSAGLPISDNHVIFGENEKFKLLNTIEDLEPYLTHLENGPTAWFCAGDRTAIALINVLKTRGVRVPEDVSVIGFDDIAMAEMILPRLTTIRIDKKKMGKLAVEYLSNLSEGRTQNAVVSNIVGELIVRDSVRRFEAAISAT